MHPRLTLASCAAILSIAAGACGGEEPRRSATPSAAPSDVAPPARSPQCGSVPLPPLPLRRTDPARADGLVAAATRAATRTGHRFHVRLDIGTGRSSPPPARIDGRRLPSNASTGALAWMDSVAVAGTTVTSDGQLRADADRLRRTRGVLLPDLAMRIVDDRLYAKLDWINPGPWRYLGSASGASLDVGRELLAHRILLEPVSATRRGDVVAVTYRAPPARLRAYATAERRGPVSALLARARRLELTAILESGRLVGDRFLLVTHVPADVPVIPAGSVVIIRGTSSYCPLRRIDRGPITSPPVR